MVMLRMWSVLWRENGHFTEVLTLMDICIFYCILWPMWCFVSCIQYILPLNLIFLFFINVFLHTAKFLHTGEGGLYACKNRASMSKQRWGTTF